MASITLKGREIPLLYTVWEMKQIQEEISPLGKFQYVISGRNPEDENDTSGYAGAEHLGAVAKLIRILGNAGLEEAGEAADLTDKKVMRAMRPAELAVFINACFEAITEGMASEFPDEKKDEPVDVTLEEINKKKAKESCRIC